MQIYGYAITYCYPVQTIGQETVNYCKSFYIGLPLKSIQNLHLVQNVIAWVVACTLQAVHITPLLLEMYSLPVIFKVQY